VVRTGGSGRRADALTRARIVATAVAILDEEGEAALTFRALAARLTTGPGAIYHHVAGKEELLAAGTEEVVSAVLARVPAAAEPREAVRCVALGVFDAIDVHPWVGTQLSGALAQPALLQLFESLGAPLAELGVPAGEQFAAGSALLNFVLGAAAQNAANARRHAPGTDRAAVLGEVSDLWASLDPARYPFLRRVAQQLREHDDREQFLAGVDLVLEGAAARARSARGT
jgi:AcrR family transcriptional regulator